MHVKNLETREDNRIVIVHIGRNNDPDCGTLTIVPDGKSQKLCRMPLVNDGQRIAYFIMEYGKAFIGTSEKEVLTGKRIMPSSELGFIDFRVELPTHFTFVCTS